MARIRYYGPSLVLIATVLVILLGGPQVMRQMVWAQQAEQVRQSRGHLMDKSQQLAELSDAFREVAKVVKPSVVHIEVSTSATSRRPTMRGSRPDPEDMLRRFFEERGRTFPDRPRDDPQSRRIPDRPQGNDTEDYRDYNMPQIYGNGSGWVYDDKGHIVTNYHVVRVADEIQVKFFDNTKRTAIVVGFDENADIAVLKIEDGGSVHPATLAEEPVEQGDIVFAFGSPFQKEFSMSQGIVSGKGRVVHILSYEDFIQTDAEIHPGNSGGPLTNIYGEVVGMNTAIATNTGVGQGVGFAIPANMLRHSVEQLIEFQEVRRGYLGVIIETVDDGMAETFGYDGQGVLIDDVLADGPAAGAGIERGDIIIAVDDRDVVTDTQLRHLIARYAPGSTVDITVFRDGEEHHIEVTLDKLPRGRISRRSSSPGGDGRDALPDELFEPLRKLGLEKVETFTEDMASDMRIDHVDGVFIHRVRPLSAAATQGLESNMLITEVMGVPIATVEELTQEIAKHDLNAGVRVTVRMGYMYRYVLLKLPD